MEDNKDNVNDDLQKSLEDNVNSLNDLLKSKKTLSKEEVEEFMKNPKNKNLFQEYMKNEDDEDDDEEEEDDEEDDEKMKKSFEDIYEEHDEVIDAVPVLKSFSKILEGLEKRTRSIENSLTSLHKSFEDGQDLQKSIGTVVSQQIDLIKSMEEELMLIGNSPLPRKGIQQSQKDLFKSDLHGDVDNGSKLQGASRSLVKEALLKSFQNQEISSLSISKWEQSGYDLSVFSKEEMNKIEQKL